MIKAQEMGIEAYNAEQHRKVKILKTLLSDYNSGRRKTFYCVAVNLLPLNDVENVSFRGQTAKEKEEEIASLFQDIAAQQGVVLKLRKKPAKKSK